MKEEDDTPGTSAPGFVPAIMVHMRRFMQRETARYAVHDNLLTVSSDVFFSTGEAIVRTVRRPG